MSFKMEFPFTTYKDYFMGELHSNQNWACDVYYLKIINVLEKYYSHPEANCLRNWKRKRKKKKKKKAIII